LPAHFLLSLFRPAKQDRFSGGKGLCVRPRQSGPEPQQRHLLFAIAVFFIPDRGLFIFPSDEKRICLG